MNTPQQKTSQPKNGTSAWGQLGQQIQAARQLKGWSRRYLGCIVGLGEQSIVSLEGGYGHRIPAGQFVAVLFLLGFQISLMSRRDRHG
jgi:DNA-binding XRE family transcriptional regulator